MSDSEKKVNRNTYNISSIKRVTRKFLEVLHYSRAKQRQRYVLKSVPYVQSFFFFLLIRPTFFGCFRCRRRLALHDFIFCLSKLIDINESFPFSSG